MHIKYSKKISNIKKYPFKILDEQILKSQSQTLETIDFGIGDPVAPTPNCIIRTLTKAAYHRASSGYPKDIGELSYRISCAQYLLREYNIIVNPHTEVSATLGSKEAIFHLPLALINPSDLVICPTPGYPMYKTGTHFAGGKVYFVPLKEKNNFLIDLDAIPHSVACKAKIIWTNYPNSPTGITAPKWWLQKLVSWGEKYNVIIAADEGCYNDIYVNKKPHSILEITRKGIITFYSLSKRNNMTCYRIGFVAGDSRIISVFRHIKTNIDSGPPTFIQDAARQALSDLNTHATMSRQYIQKRNIISKAMVARGFSITTSNSTFYLWQKCKNGLTGKKLTKYLLKIGILVLPGSLISDTINTNFNPGIHFVRFALMPNTIDTKEASHRIKYKLVL